MGRSPPERPICLPGTSRVDGGLCSYKSHKGAQPNHGPSQIILPQIAVAKILDGEVVVAPQDLEECLEGRRIGYAPSQARHAQERQWPERDEPQAGDRHWP